jgi:hypothetical protein
MTATLFSGDAPDDHDRCSVDTGDFRLMSRRIVDELKAPAGAQPFFCAAS